MKIFKKADIVFITFLIIAISVSIFYIYTSNNFEKENIVIEVNGEIFGTFDLSKNQEIEINSLNGGENIAIIHDRIVSMKYANCPDQICIHQPAIESNFGVIVCLPNQVLLYKESPDNGDIDMVS